MSRAPYRKPAQPRTPASEHSCEPISTSRGRTLPAPQFGLCRVALPHDDPWSPAIPGLRHRSLRLRSGTTYRGVLTAYAPPADLRLRGLPPFLPFSREAAAFASDRTLPPFRPMRDKYSATGSRFISPPCQELTQNNPNGLGSQEDLMNDDSIWLDKMRIRANTVLFKIARQIRQTIPHQSSDPHEAGAASLMPHLLKQRWRNTPEFGEFLFGEQFFLFAAHFQSPITSATIRYYRRVSTVDCQTP